MQLLFDAAARVLKALLFLAFLGLIGVVLIQVVSRVALPRSPVWTEELSRFTLLYLVAIGAGLAVRTGELVNVDLLVGRLGGRTRRVWTGALALGCIGLAAALIAPGLRFTAIGAFQTSPALGWSMTWIHAIVVIIPALLIVFYLEVLLRAVWPRRDRPGPDS